MNFEGFHLPGLDVAQIAAWGTLERPGIRVRWPMLEPGNLESVWRHLSSRRERVLLGTPVSEIVSAIDTAVALMEREQPATVELLSSFTGYSREIVAQTLTHMLRDWRADSLHTLLQSEFRDPHALDGPVPDPALPGKRTAVYGYPRALHIFSGNVPGVAVTSLVRSLLVKSATLGKTASGEPILPVLFARALCDVSPALAECLAVTYWPGASPQLDEAAIRAADVVVIYGGDEAVSSYQRAAAGKRVVVHGPRLSFGVVGGDHDPSIARDVAHAVAAYDQQGCVSPHLVYVIGDQGAASRFARAVGEELHKLAAALPRGALTAGEAVAIRNARTAAEFADDTELIGSEQDGFAVIVEKDPSFKLSCLNRILYVKAVATIPQVLAQLPAAEHLQSAALAGLNETEKAGLARSLGLAGVSRITSFAQLPWPPMHWHHDGSTPLGELVRWQDIEPD
ncbi:MAG TPA: acyl-CoA reductase [Longimicrobiales bacterium]